ncbi:membrane protein, partial [Candidatus Magnetomorum sp. HK-1]
FTVVIVYLRYKGFALASLISDLIFIRWLEFFPQFFLLLISFHIITENMNSADKRMPFIWSIVICWTLGPYIYRQLQPVVTSFFKSRVYDAEILIGEKKWKIFFNYLICQHCFTLILILTCFVFGNLILIESCMAYLVNFSNHGEFPSLGGSLSSLFKTHTEGNYGWELYLNLPLEAIMTMYFIFAGVIFFIVAGKLIQIVQNEFKQVLWEK